MRDVGFNWSLPRALPLHPDKCQTHLHTVIVFFKNRDMVRKERKKRKMYFCPQQWGSTLQMWIDPHCCLNVYILQGHFWRRVTLNVHIYITESCKQKPLHWGWEQRALCEYLIQGASIFICVCTWKLPTEEIWKNNWELGPRGLCKENTTDPMPPVAYTLASLDKLCKWKYRSPK